MSDDVCLIFSNVYRCEGRNVISTYLCLIFALQAVIGQHVLSPETVSFSFQRKTLGIEGHALLSELIHVLLETVAQAEYMTTTGLYVRNDQKRL